MCNIINIFSNNIQVLVLFKLKQIIISNYDKILLRRKIVLVISPLKTVKINKYEGKAEFGYSPLMNLIQKFSMFNSSPIM